MGSGAMIHWDCSRQEEPLLPRLQQTAGGWLVSRVLPLPSFSVTLKNNNPASASKLTNEADGLGEELRQVLAPVVRDGDLLVLELAGVLEEVGQVGRDVEDVLDAVLLQHVQVGGVLGAAQVEVGQDLHGEGGLRVGQRAAVDRLGGAAGVAVDVRLDVRRVGADAQAAQAQHLRGGRAAVGRAVQVGLAQRRELSLELAEAAWKVCGEEKSRVRRVPHCKNEKIQWGKKL